MMAEKVKVKILMDDQCRKEEGKSGRSLKIEILSINSFLSADFSYPESGSVFPLRIRIQEI